MYVFSDYLDEIKNEVLVAQHDLCFWEGSKTSKWIFKHLKRCLKPSSSLSDSGLDYRKHYIVHWIPESIVWSPNYTSSRFN